jgi:hypothetical protein
MGETMVESLHAVADDVPPPVRSWRDRLTEYLREAASRLEVTLVGAPSYGFNERTIGCTVRYGRRGGWLRVVTTDPGWTDNPLWRGNAKANAIQGVAKPRLIASREWLVGCELAVRAELFTLAPSPTCSALVTPSPGLELPERWWNDLRRSLDALASWPTEPSELDQDAFMNEQLIFFGAHCGPITRWSTAHGDLHWANLTAPEFCLLDWEGWGPAPAGYDAALLYCSSLLQPALARRVRDVFADLLEGQEGSQALLCAAAKTLSMIHNDIATVDLAVPVHRLAAQLLA